MRFGFFLRHAARAACVALPLATPQLVHAQDRTVVASATAAVGANPTAIAFNPVTRKIYVANHDENTVTVLAAEIPSARVIATVPVGRQPNHIVVNTETDAVYVSNEGDGSLSIIDARTDRVRATTNVVVGGAMTVNPTDNHMYMLRESPSDEFNVVSGDTFVQADAVRSYKPVTLAVNPVTNRLFVGTEASTDVVPFVLDDRTDYPLRECPDGHGGLLPDSGKTNPDPRACIDVPGYPVSVAVNPVNNRAYSLSSTGEVTVIQGPNMTWNSITLPSGIAGSGSVAIAVNPVANVIYALYQNRVVFLRGSDNGVLLARDLPSPGVGLAVDVKRNLVFVAMSGGQLMWIGSDLSGVNSGTIATPADTRGVVFDPEGLRPYVLSASGVSTVTVSGDFPLSGTNPLQALVRVVPNNRVGTAGSFVIDASSAMTPAPLDQVRAVFYRILGAANNNGAAPFQKAVANGDGSWTASFSGLAERSSYTLEYYATNGLDMSSIDTDKVSAPVTSTPGVYSFSTGPLILSRRLVDFNNDGRGDISWRNADGSQGLWLMNGGTYGTAASIARPVPSAKVVQLADFDGDGRTDLLWRADGGAYYVSLMNGLTATSSAMIWAGGDGWEVVGTYESDGTGGRDLLWKHPTQGYGYWTMRGTTVTSMGALPPPAPGYEVAFTADFSAFGNETPLWVHPDGRVFMSGRQVLQAGTGWTPKLLGDFNGDKRKDILWRHSDGSWGMWLVDGATMLKGVTLIGPGSGYEAVLVRDLNGDGMSDIVWRRGDRKYEAWLMNGVDVIARRVLVEAGSGWTLVGSDDYDADGKFDLLWREDATGQYGTWLMDGLQPTAMRSVVPPRSGWEAAP